MLASSLYQTGAWIKSRGVVSTQVSSGYLKMQIDSHSKDISDFLSAMLGEQIHFEVSLKQIVNTPVEQTAPDQVKILCNLFKGQIVGHSKKSEQEIANEAAQRNAEKAAAESSGEDEED